MNEDDLLTPEQRHAHVDIASRAQAVRQFMESEAGLYVFNNLHDVYLNALLDAKPGDATGILLAHQFYAVWKSVEEHFKQIAQSGTISAQVLENDDTLRKTIEQARIGSVSNG